MTDKPKISISWSGGKDSALALHRLINQDEFEIVEIHTVFESDTKRVGIHNIPEAFIEAQAEKLGIPLKKLCLEKRPMAYQKLMTDYYKQLKSEGVEHVMFGDIFLEDLKDFREMMLKSAGIKGVYPLWKEDTKNLINEFFEFDFQSVLCTVDSKFIDQKYCGRLISPSFINNHPDIDPCGENGEYHSFVIEGPIFDFKIKVNSNGTYSQQHTFKVKDEDGSEKEFKELFYYSDLELLLKS